MRYWLIALSLVSACASAPPTAPVASHGPQDLRLWIPDDEPGDRPVCVELRESNSLYTYRCVPLKELRALLDKMGSI